MPSSVNIADNINQIQQKIADYATKYQRNQQDITLLAVSKTRPAEDIRQAWRAGQLDFGESYLQEALEKIAQLRQLPLTWHFIGAIQSNKTRDIASHFAWVHSVDRYKIAQRLSQQRDPRLAPLNICLQVNISGEHSKSGIQLGELPDLAARLRNLPGLRFRGLMAIPAKAESFQQQRAIFRQLRDALDQLNGQGYTLDTLSMGMTSDMEAAIAEGATIVRIGTAIFGARS
jgi:hypothetical protein